MLCFCYGSNMSERRLQARVPSARFFAVGELSGHRLRFHKAAMDGSAKCDAEETGDPNDRVIGVIYEIADNEKPDLDRHEALGRGYEEKQVELVTGKERLHAWMYFATRINDSLKPFHWYKDHVLIGARENRLPADYIALIEAVESIEDPKRSRRERELGIYRDTGVRRSTGTGRKDELIEFETERLLLRQWKPADRAPFAALNSDPRVMEYFPALLTRAESDAMADRCESLIWERGWGFWAAELKATGEFIGFVGLHTPSARLPFSPCVEVGWRLAFKHWGKGLATEAAQGALHIGFESLGFREIVSFTAVGNQRSRAVMEKLSMQESGTFEHPQLPEDSRLRLHCLYRLSMNQNPAD